MPLTSNGGLLYYRKDLAPTPPRTWDEMMRSCDVAVARGIGCYAGQYAVQEGFAVNVAEAINTDGGSFSDDGKTVAVDSARSVRGGTGPAGRGAGGRADLRRSPRLRRREESAGLRGRSAHVHAGLAEGVQFRQHRQRLDRQGRRRHRSAPGVSADRLGVSSLGRHNAAISAYSQNKDTAYDFLQTAEIQKMFLQGSPRI